MTRAIAVLLAVTLCLPFAAARGEGAFTPVSPEGLKAELAARQGQVVLVNFWATWCRPCLKEIPVLLELEKSLGPRGFALVLVSLDEPADRAAIVAPFLAKHFPDLRTFGRETRDMDGTVSVLDPAWNEVLPTSYVLGRDGQVATRLQGGKTAAQFEAAIVPLLPAP